MKVNTKEYLLWTLVSFFTVSPYLLGQANASFHDQLQQLTAQLQQSPADQMLREKIITLVLTLKPKPATPTAATQAEGAAEYARVSNEKLCPPESC